MQDYWKNRITCKNFTDAIERCGFSDTKEKGKNTFEDHYKCFIAGLNVAQTRQWIGEANVTEVALFLSIVVYESQGLKLWEEKNPRDCSNLRDSGCDEMYITMAKNYNNVRFHGRGFLHMTWFFNYYNCSMALFGDDRLARNPGLVVTELQTAWDSAFWFWGTTLHRKRGIQQGELGVAVDIITDGAMESQEKTEKRNLYFRLLKKTFGA